MALSIVVSKPACATCEKGIGVFTCGGCTRTFCTKHANEHRQMLGQQMDEIVYEHDRLQQSINEQLNNIHQSSSFKEIDEWERIMIEKINRTAENVRQKLKQCLIERTQSIQMMVQDLTKELNKARMEDDFIEADLKLWLNKMKKLKTDLSASIPIFIETSNNKLIPLVYQHQSQAEPIVVIIDPFYTKVKQANNYYGIEGKPASTSDSTKDLLNSISGTAMLTLDISEPYSFISVVRLFKTSEGFGLVIAGGREQNLPLYISRIIPDSVAWKHGGLRIGDRLLSVNGVSVENEYHEKAIDLIKQAQGNVELVVCHPPYIVIKMNNLF